MKAAFVAFVAFASAPALAAPAFAECPAEAVQTAATLVDMIGRTPSSIPSALRQITQLAKDCPASPHVQKLAGFAYGATVGGVTDVDKAYEQALAGWRYTLAMRAARAPNEKPIDVALVNGSAKVDVYGMDQYEQSSLRGLLITSFNAGKIPPMYEPLKPGEKPVCNASDPLDVGVASRLLQDNPERIIPAAANLMQRAIAACDAKMATSDLDRGMLGLRAKALLKQVQAKPDRPDAEAILAQAEADAKHFHALKGDWDVLYFARSDADALDALVREKKH